jgi:hypothetical protein
LKNTDDFANLSPTQIEDLVIKSCFGKTEVGDKVFPLLSSELFSDDRNQKIVNIIKEYHSEHNKYPRPRELYDFKLKTKELKDRFEEIGKIS